MELSENIKLDWLSFTLSHTEESMERARSLAGTGKQEELGYGRFRYNRGVGILDGGHIYYNRDRKEMGIHVALNSASLAMMEYRPLQLINLVLDWGATIKRIDIAFDDMSGLLDPDEMYRKILAGELVTRYRKVTRVSGQDLGEPQKTGDTINLGKRSSGSFIRIYDKMAEVLAKGGDVPEGVKNWVRVEMEAKGEKAHAIGNLIGQCATRQGTSPGQELSNLLYGLLDFKDVNPDDDNKSRWHTSEFWSTFLAATSKKTLSLPKRERSVERSKTWVRNQVSTTLAMIILSQDDPNGQSGWEFIVESIILGAAKISKLQEDMIDQYSREVGDRVLAR